MTATPQLFLSLSADAIHIEGGWPTDETASVQSRDAEAVYHERLSLPASTSQRARHGPTRSSAAFTLYTWNGDTLTWEVVIPSRNALADAPAPA
jgi:hypothetical protein